jgi:hypothetical protein
LKSAGEPATAHPETVAEELSPALKEMGINDRDT